MRVARMVMEFARERRMRSSAMAATRSLRTFPPRAKVWMRMRMSGPHVPPGDDLEVPRWPAKTDQL
jgi:hypothetical protein